MSATVNSAPVTYACSPSHASRPVSPRSAHFHEVGATLLGDVVGLLLGVREHDHRDDGLDGRERGEAPARDSGARLRIRQPAGIVGEVEEDRARFREHEAIVLDHRERGVAPVRIAVATQSKSIGVSATRASRVAERLHTVIARAMAARRTPPRVVRPCA
jgi:hypothetical protein